MGVIYIGDRAVGKTHLALELANPQANSVKVVTGDYDNLKQLLYSEQEGKTKPTDDNSSIHCRSLEVEVQLPKGAKQITLDWLDTPGEIWRKNWQSTRPDEWQKFTLTLSQSEGVILVLPPYRELITSTVNLDEFVTQQQWCNRFEKWINFFQTNCPRVRHLLLCLNKADLFCNLDKEAKHLAYKRHGSLMNWQQRESYVSQRYFYPIQSSIQTLNNSFSGLGVRCFITSIKNRDLLELPWIYLGTFLASY